MVGGAHVREGQLRSALRAYALEDPSPARVVARLDDLVESLGRGEMTSLVYGVFDPQAKVARLVCAGHLPPLVLEPDGTHCYIEEERWTPLGVASLARPDTGGAPAPTEAVFCLEPGSQLVLYTDGLVERPGRSLDSGLAALARAVTSASGDPAKLSDAVLAELLDDDPAGDGIALLVLSPTGGQ